MLGVRDIAIMQIPAPLFTQRKGLTIILPDLKSLLAPKEERTTQL